jgi:signal peptidase I
MTKKKRRKQMPSRGTGCVPVPPAEDRVEETPFEAVASICSVLVVGLFILTFLGQNFVIPSGSMEKTLLVGDHLVVDRITLAPPAKWMPLVHYREPKRGDVVVFIKPVPDLMQGRKAAVSVPGEAAGRSAGRPYSSAQRHRDHQRRGAGPASCEADNAPANHRTFWTSFPPCRLTRNAGRHRSLGVDFPNHIEDGDLVVPPGKYFMMGDNRHDSLDSRYWGFVPERTLWGGRCSTTGRSRRRRISTSRPGLAIVVAWMGHVALHFFSDTRWKRTLHDSLMS